MMFRVNQQRPFKPKAKAIFVNQFGQPIQFVHSVHPIQFVQSGQPVKRCRVKGCTYCPPGKPHYCKNCGSRDSDHFKTNCPKLRKKKSGKKDLRNSAIVLKKNNKILLLKDRRRYWVTPGGGRNRGEKPWHAAKREYKEETGNNDLPYCYTIERFDFLRYNTNIYVCQTNRSVSFSPNNETYKAKWVSVSDIVKDTNNNLNIRQSNKATLMSLYKMRKI